MREEENLLDKAKRIYYERAERIAGCEDRLKELLTKVYAKLNDLVNSPLIQESRFKIEVFYRMVRAHMKDEYKGLSKRSLVLLVLGLLYFILPVDFVPDFIPGIGYLDDITVLLGVYKSLQTDIEKFLEWEASGA